MSVFGPGNTAVITGGASGIGLALAAKCLASGMRVLVADKDAASLAATPKHAAQLAETLYGGASASGSLTTHTLDVSQLKDWAGLRSAVEDASGPFQGRVNLLVLNAGVGGSTPWTDVAAFHKILDVNLWGVIHGIATLLPVVQATAARANVAPTATTTSIVITGSKQGITNPPGTSPAYNASKAAVRAIAEQLAYDLSREDSKANQPKTGVHLLVPGWTFTGLSGNDPIKQHGDDADKRPKKPEGAWWPEQVVDYLLAAMKANKFYVICPDNDVTEAMDKKRILWSAGDITEGREPLSRWRPSYKDAVDAWMKK
ncbi:NADP(+)-dependent dehydrogenase [Sporothrix brasiliensis 5110]|uniref:NADP(+)-dependent dehydrogenase n=1 Tax=Sporothrix brasiliensis 5110 TaxID=1398154 RepID=A0A0C2IXJ5_9PEZI|nr:NADP(+)-dependent dehydrogenase [Sporothrix brasiliensis 5110]KIH91470.1 NADP(+)-dependent dehydrogenase [Sporothrix brasiliensis 5110]